MEAWFLSENKDFADGYGAKRSIAAEEDQGDGRVTTGGAGVLRHSLEQRKAPPACAGGAEIEPDLEGNLQRQLHVESLAGAQSRSTVEVANGIGHLAEAFGCGAHARCISSATCAN